MAAAKTTETAEKTTTTKTTKTTTKASAEKTAATKKTTAKASAEKTAEATEKKAAPKKTTAKSATEKTATAEKKTASKTATASKETTAKTSAAAKKTVKKAEEPTLLEQWRATAYREEGDQNELQQFWGRYFELERGIYEQILADYKNPVKGTVQELADKFGVKLLAMVGFLDGINDSLKEQNPIETMDENTVVNLGFDKELLYKNMVDAKADWLYNLPQWDAIFTEEKKKELYLEQKKSGTVVKAKKVGRNDPCPCGSGKKYKFCCGR